MLLQAIPSASEDQYFSEDSNDGLFRHHLFKRLSAKGKKFQNVNFCYSTFDSCYLRNCTFIKCDFTGCRFLASNFRGSTFAGCKFDYVYFEKTLVADDILDHECPSEENLKAEFARTLRVNFAQLGLAESVNKAIHVELAATRTHLYNSWASKSSYYREKYTGYLRFRSFVLWGRFRTLDLLWGNGESAAKLFVSLMVVLAMIACFGAAEFRDSSKVRTYWDAIREAPTILLGVTSPPEYPKWLLTAAACLRLLFFAAFMAIINKRYNRR